MDKKEEEQQNEKRRHLNGYITKRGYTGLSMAFAQNLNALNKFSTMDKSQQQHVIDGTKSIQSKEEMRRYVSSLAEDRYF